MTTQLKHGEVLERIVRRDRMGISELSRQLHVSRKTVYNWFGQDKLSGQLIWQVSNLLHKDFSDSFPGMDIGNVSEKIIKEKSTNADSGTETVYFWMNKYIVLLEEYNDMLSKGPNRNTII